MNNRFFKIIDHGYASLVGDVVSFFEAEPRGGQIYFINAPGREPNRWSNGPFFTLDEMEGFAVEMTPEEAQAYCYAATINPWTV